MRLLLVLALAAPSSASAQALRAAVDAPATVVPSFGASVAAVPAFEPALAYGFSAPSLAPALVAPSALTPALSAASVPGEAKPKLEDLVKFKLTTPTLEVDSGRLFDGARRLGLLAGQGAPEPAKTATDAQVRLARRAVRALPAAFPGLAKWLAFEAAPVEPAVAAKKVASLVEASIARPDEALGPLAPLLPKGSAAVTGGGLLLKGLRFFGIDFGLARKGAAAAATTEQEALEFIEAFEELLPIAIGGVVSSLNMGKASGAEIDLRDAVPRVTAKAMMRAFGLALTPKQEKSLDREIARAYRRFFAEWSRFMVRRRGDAKESFAALVNALAGDLPGALRRLGALAAAIKRAN